MRWIEGFVFLEAAVSFVLAALSCLYLVPYAVEAPTAARKAGGLALAVVCAGLALEALLYLALAPGVAGLSLTRIVAVLFVRSALLVSSGLIGTLLWRALR